MYKKNGENGEQPHPRPWGHNLYDEGLILTEEEFLFWKMFDHLSFSVEIFILIRLQQDNTYFFPAN